MCEELGNDDHMNAYVMEAGKTSLCDVDTSAGCSDKEKKFIETYKTKTQAEVTKQIERLTKMSAKSMKESLKAWLSQRLAILNQFAKKAAGKEEL